ncbi:hypothetical protein D9M71_278840 [compost metagenome]
MEAAQALLHLVQLFQLADHRIDLAEQLCQFAGLILGSLAASAQCRGGFLSRATNVPDILGGSSAAGSELVGICSGSIELLARLPGCVTHRADGLPKVVQGLLALGKVSADAQGEFQIFAGHVGRSHRGRWLECSPARAYRSFRQAEKNAPGPSPGAL